MRNLPSDPPRRRIIVVLDQTDYERLDYDDSADLGKRPDVALMKWPAEPDDELATRLERQGSALPGSVLIQSPYSPDDYASEADASDSFALQKVAVFTRLCQLLGAREVVVEVLEDERSQRQYRTEVQAGKGPVKVTGKVAHDSFNTVASNISWIDTYEGAPADTANARDLLRRSNLDHDPTLASLVEACEAEGNRQRSRTLTVDLSRESKKVLDVAAGLKIPSALSASVTFKREAVTTSRYRVTYKVTF